MLPDTQAVIDALPDCILLVEPDGIVIAGNTAARRVLRRDPGSLPGRSILELIDSPAEFATAYLRRCAASLQFFPGTLVFRAADGSHLEARCEGARIRLGDGTLGPIMLRCRPKREAVSQFTILNDKIAELTREIAARRAAEDAFRESEARWRNFTETIPALVFVTDAGGRNIYTNQYFSAFTGVAAEALLGEGWLQTVQPEDRERARETWDHAWRAALPYEAEYRIRRRDGGYSSHLFRGLPIRDAEGRVMRWIGSGTEFQEIVDARQALARVNTTLERRVAERTRELREANDRLIAETAERQKAEEALRQAQKMEAIGQLTGGIAHDFNNILHVILGNLDALRRSTAGGLDELAPGDLNRLVANAIRGAERAATLTQRLLAFGRRQPLSPMPVDTNRLVAGMSELLRRTLGEAISVETVLGGGLWRTLADANQLESALLNLAVNARDAMPDGGKLTIETANASLDETYAAAHQEVQAGQYVMVAVSDTGTGMSREIMEKAFDPFFTTKAIGQGTGLGLSQVYGFVKQSGGHIKLYSEPREGTTVKLYLPRMRTDHPGADEIHSDTIAPHGNNHETILLVDDDEDVRANTAEMLRDLGFRVIAAANGAAALQLLDTNPDVALLLTDVGLPGGLNGRQLAEEARRRRPEMPVLFTTGYARNAIVHHGRLDPDVELLTKPFSLANLAAKIHQLLGS